jgi:hypothetical protein
MEGPDAHVNPPASESSAHGTVNGDQQEVKAQQEQEEEGNVDEKEQQEIQ